LPRETELYVPRLLALSKIIENPRKYGFKLPEFNNKNDTSKVKFYDPIDFQTLSIITGISEEKLMILNPGYSTWIIDPSQQNILLLPNKAAKLFKSRYKKIANIIYENKVYKVKKGDSLYKISRMYNVKIDSIKKFNSLSSNTIYINQEIKIPSELNISTKEFITINNQKYYVNKKEVTYNHVIRRYDNWYKIARKYDVPLKTLLKWNDANKKTRLKVNALVKIKLKGPILSKNKKVQSLRYVVNSGERYDQIIRGFGVSKDKLIKDNKLKNKKYLTAGDNLIINQN
jgi:membrane-bound lytic murein transglycosylase D